MTDSSTSPTHTGFNTLKSKRKGKSLFIDLLHAFDRFSICSHSYFIFFGGYKILEWNSSDSLCIQQIGTGMKVSCPKNKKQSRSTTLTPHSRLLRALSMHPDHFGGENKNWNQDNFVKLSNSLVSEKNMAASVQYVTLPWTCTVRFVSSCPAIYNIWQQSGLTKSCLSFQNKRPTDDAPILTQIAAYPCTSWERNLITIEV